MKPLTRFLIPLTTIWILFACTAINTPNFAFYQSTDNKNINLLEFEYGDYHRAYEKEISNSIGRISFTSARVGESLTIKWQDKTDGKIKSKKISLHQGLPFNMKDSQVRLTFNDTNQPEVYIFYNGPAPYNFFTFKGHPYSRVRVRQIYPINQEINIDVNQ